MDFKDHLKIAGKLTLICFCAVLLLTIVNYVTAGQIERIERKEEKDALSDLFTGRKDLTFTKKSFSDSSVDSNKEYYFIVKDNSGTLVGYVVSVFNKKGYGGKIKMLAAFNPKLAVIEMKMMTNSETPGFGKKYEKEKNIALFRGSNTMEYPFPLSKSRVKKEYKDAVTGATITFNALRDGGLRAIKLLKDEL